VTRTTARILWDRGRSNWPAGALLAEARRAAERAASKLTAKKERKGARR